MRKTRLQSPDEYGVCINYAVELAREKMMVAQALTALDSHLADFVNVLAHSNATCSLDGAGGLRRACEAYACIEYGMEDEVNQSVVCFGAIAVNRQVLKAAEAVNARKAELRQVCAPLQNRRVRVPVKGDSGPTKAIPAVRFILKSIQRSDLNLLAAYRNIPILSAPPVSITFTRANTRSVYRKSVEELLTILMTYEGPQASADRARLMALSPRETHLAYVKGRYQNLRANVLYGRLDARGRGRVQIAAELPILYLGGREDPEIRFPEDGEAPPLPSRARQAKIEEQSFLLSLPVYRYLSAKAEISSDR